MAGTMSAGTAATGPPIQNRTTMNIRMKGRSTNTVKLADPMTSLSKSKSRIVEARAPVAFRFRDESWREILSNNSVETCLSILRLALSTKLPRIIFITKSKIIITPIISVRTISDSVALFGITRSYTVII